MNTDDEYSLAKLLAAIDDRGITLWVKSVNGRTWWTMAYGGGILHRLKPTGTATPLNAATLTELRVLCDGVENWAVMEHRWRDEWADRDPWRRCWVVR